MELNRQPTQSAIKINDSVFANVKFKISVRHPHGKVKVATENVSQEAQRRLSTGDINLGITA